MALLQLPRVIFEQIIDEAVEFEGRLFFQQAVRYRLVCRVFGDFVSESVIWRAARDSFADPKLIWASSTVYHHQTFSTAVLQRKVTLRNDKIPLVEGLNALVDALLEREWLSDPDGEMAAEIRMRYTKNLCDALRALEYGELYKKIGPWNSGRGALELNMTAATCAVGHVQTFTSIAHSIEDILEPGDGFPNALDAAVGANQTEMVDVILKWLVGAVRGPWQSPGGTWDEMRYVAKAIAEAFRLAIRLSHNDVGKIILEVSLEHDVLTNSVHFSQVKTLFEECVKYGNDTFYGALRVWKANDRPHQSYKWPLQKRDFSYIIRRGKACFFRALIRNGMVNVNLVEDETPLWLTLQARRYALADVLLEEGAKIDAVAPGQTESSYWRARRETHGNSQWYLIDKGADTRPMSEHGKPIDPKEDRFYPHIRTSGHDHPFDVWKLL